MTTIFTASIVLLALSLVPILISKSKVLLARWLSWLAILAAFSFASLFGKTGFAILLLAIGFICWLEGTALEEEAAAFGRRKVVATFAYKWLVAFMAVLLALQNLVTSPQLIASLVFIVALFDIGGWVGGKLLTRWPPLDRKLFAVTSPNKTWGGLVGSLVLGFAANVLVANYSIGSYLVIATFAVAGDWLESWVKRASGAKDAAEWLPGFGGLLDRFDSVLPMSLALLIIGF